MGREIFFRFTGRKEEGENEEKYFYVLLHPSMLIVKSLMANREGYIYERLTMNN